LIIRERKEIGLLQIETENDSCRMIDSKRKKGKSSLKQELYISRKQW